jgi:hypothetical protein
MGLTMALAADNPLRGAQAERRRKGADLFFLLQAQGKPDAQTDFEAFGRGGVPRPSDAFLA